MPSDTGKRKARGLITAPQTFTNILYHVKGATSSAFWMKNGDNLEFLEIIFTEYLLPVSGQSVGYQLSRF